MKLPKKQARSANVVTKTSVQTQALGKPSLSKNQPIKQTKQAKEDNSLIDMPITEHLIELRMRLIKITIAIGVALVPLGFYFSEVYLLFSQPLVAALPDHSHIVATDLVSGFMAQVRLCVLLAVFMVTPYILFQIWSFIAPGLYRHEKKAALPILLSAITLFYLGVAFAYFIILQRALVFLITILPANVVSMPDMQSYLNFATKILFVFGITFEIPVLVFILVATGLVTTAALIDKRRYIIVGCFAAAGMLSPPDVPTMFMLALPMILLFELGLLATKLFIKQHDGELTTDDITPSAHF